MQKRSLWRPLKIWLKIIGHTKKIHDGSFTLTKCMHSNCSSNLNLLWWSLCSIKQALSIQLQTKSSYFRVLYLRMSYKPHKIPGVTNIFTKTNYHNTIHLKSLEKGRLSILFMLTSWLYTEKKTYLCMRITSDNLKRDTLKAVK